MKPVRNAESTQRSTHLLYIIRYHIITALPVELTKCETQLLLDEGVATLVSKAKALTASPDPEMLQTYKLNFEAGLLAQADALKAEKLRETERHVEKIIKGKRNKLLKLGKTTEGG